MIALLLNHGDVLSWNGVATQKGVATPCECWDAVWMCQPLRYQVAEYLIKPVVVTATACSSKPRKEFLSLRILLALQHMGLCFYFHSAAWTEVSSVVVAVV